MNTSELVRLSLTSDEAQRVIRERLGVQTAQEFVAFVAKERGCDIVEARRVILDNPELMRLMFAIA